MPIVDVRWRPSGGRGEYEHVPVDVLLDRNVVLAPLVVGDAVIRTDVWGRIRDGKPRLRRHDPNDRSILNLPQLVAALALLPDPRREDLGEAVFPLRAKGFVISSITFNVDLQDENVAVCTPLRMKVLHDSGEIDLKGRLTRVGTLLMSDLVPREIIGVAKSFLNLIQSGSASAQLREYADEILLWIAGDSGASSYLDAPSALISVEPSTTGGEIVKLEDMGVDETKRKLRAHYKIDRSRKIRAAKVEQFKDKYGAVYCENCSFDFSTKYGLRGDGFIEVHHVIPLAAILPNTITYLSDLMLLCSNCHRMVHRRRPDLSPEELRGTTR